MRNIWAAQTTPISLKLRIYKTGVCSRLTYGSEAWQLTARVCAMINGANSRMVSRITKRSIHEEASPSTRTFDVVRWIRARRLQWVGHILRMDPSRLVHKAARHIFDNRSEGDLLMDTPGDRSWDELKALAADRAGWRSRVRALRINQVSAVTITINPALPGTHNYSTRSQQSTPDHQHPTYFFD